MVVVMLPTPNKEITSSHHSIAGYNKTALFRTELAVNTTLGRLWWPTASTAEATLHIRTHVESKSGVHAASPSMASRVSLFVALRSSAAFSS